KNYEEMSQVAASHVMGYMYKEERVNLSITAGETPIRTYEILAPIVKEGDFTNVHFYNFDEIPFKQEDREGVTMLVLREYFFNKTNTPEENIHILDHTNYMNQDLRIKKDGGLNMVLLGIGEDGHFCGNLPGTTKFGDLTSRVSCKEEDLVDEFEGHIEFTPNYYVTMGPRSIMRAKHLVMIATGKRKAAAIKKLLSFEIDQNFPASILTLHPNFTLILDEDAASLLDNETKIKIASQSL
ncbi:MAG: glucosamine-6-phosphate deaminase, partial [Longicatena sp.]